MDVTNADRKCPLKLKETVLTLFNQKNILSVLKLRFLIDLKKFLKPISDHAPTQLPQPLVQSLCNKYNIPYIIKTENWII